jgi:HEPN domain-containing protein
MLKAAFVHRKGIHAPYGHGLLTLAEEAGLTLTQGQQDVLDRLTAYNLDTRYPEDQPALYKKYTRKFCESEISEIRKVGKWLESLLK